MRKHENEVHDKNLDQSNDSIIMHKKETYGFKSANSGPLIPEIQDFERKFWGMIRNIKFFNPPNKHQIKLRKDLDRLKQLTKGAVQI